MKLDSKTLRLYVQKAVDEGDTESAIMLENAATRAEAEERQEEAVKYQAKMEYAGNRNPVVQAAEDITAKAIDWAPMLIPGGAGLVVGTLDAATGHLPRQAFNWMTGRDDPGGDAWHELAVQGGLTVPGILQGMGMNKAAVAAKGLAGLFGAKVLSDVVETGRADAAAVGQEPTLTNALGQMVTPGVQGVTHGADPFNLYFNAKMVGHGAQAGAAAELARRGVRPSEMAGFEKKMSGLPFMGTEQKPGVLRPESYLHDLASLSDMGKADQYTTVQQDGTAKLDPASRETITPDTEGKEVFGYFDGVDKVGLLTDALYMRWRKGGSIDVAIDKDGNSRLIKEGEVLEPGETAQRVDLQGVPWENVRDSTLVHELTHARANEGVAAGDENLAWAVQSLATDNPEAFEIWVDKAKRTSPFDYEAGVIRRDKQRQIGELMQDIRETKADVPKGGRSRFNKKVNRAVQNQDVDALRGIIRKKSPEADLMEQQRLAALQEGDEAGMGMREDADTTITENLANKYQGVEDAELERMALRGEITQQEFEAEARRRSIMPYEDTSPYAYAQSEVRGGTRQYPKEWNQDPFTFLQTGESDFTSPLQTLFKPKPQPQPAPKPQPQPAPKPEPQPAGGKKSIAENTIERFATIEDANRTSEDRSGAYSAVRNLLYRMSKEGPEEVLAETNLSDTAKDFLRNEFKSYNKNFTSPSVRLDEAGVKVVVGNSLSNLLDPNSKLKDRRPALSLLNRFAEEALAQVKQKMNEGKLSMSDASDLFEEINRAGNAKIQLGGKSFMSLGKKAEPESWWKRIVGGKKKVIDDERAAKALEGAVDVEEARMRRPVAEELPLKVVEHPSPGYAPRTEHNAKAADVTVAIALDFESAGEKLTKKVSKNYIPLDMKKTAAENGQALAKMLANKGYKVLNLAGNGLYTLAKKVKGVTQDRVDKYVYNLIKTAHEASPIEKIVTGGQTGIDIAAAKAAHNLHIPVEVTLPKGFKQRNQYGKDVSMTEKDIRRQITGEEEAYNKEPDYMPDREPTDTPDTPDTPELKRTQEHIVETIEDAVQGIGGKIDGKKLAEIIRTKFTDGDIGELKRIHELLVGEEGRTYEKTANETMADDSAEAFEGISSFEQIRGGVLEASEKTGLRDRVADLAEALGVISGDLHDPVTINPAIPIGKKSSNITPAVRKAIVTAIRLGRKILAPKASIRGIIEFWRNKGSEDKWTSLKEAYPEMRLRIGALKPGLEGDKITIRNKKTGKLQTVRENSFNVFQTRNNPAVENNMVAEAVNAFNKTQPEKLRAAARFAVKMGKLFKGTKTLDEAKKAFVDELVGAHAPPKPTGKVSQKKMSEWENEVAAVQREATFMFDSVFNYLKNMGPEDKWNSLFEAVQTFDKTIGKERVSKDIAGQLIEQGAVSADFKATLKTLGIKKGELTPTAEAFLYVNEVKRALQNGLDPEALGVERDPETGYLRFDNVRREEVKTEQGEVKRRIIVSTEHLRNWNNIRELNHLLNKLSLAKKQDMYADKIEQFDTLGLPDPLAPDVGEAGKRETVLSEDGYPIDIEKEIDAPFAPERASAEAVEGYVGKIMYQFTREKKEIPENIIDLVANMVPENKAPIYTSLLKAVNEATSQGKTPVEIEKAVHKQLEKPVFSYMALGKKDDAALVTKFLRGAGKFLYNFDSTRSYFADTLSSLESSFAEFFPNDPNKVSQFSKVAREGQKLSVESVDRQAIVEETAYKHKLPELMNSLDPKSKWYTNATDILEGRVQVSGKDAEMLKAITGFRDEMTALFKADGAEYGDAALQSIKNWVPNDFKEKYGNSGAWLMAAYKYIASLTNIDPNALKESSLADGVLAANRSEFKALGDSFMKARQEIIDKNPHLSDKAIDAILQFDVMQKLGLYNYDLVGRGKATEMAKKIPLGKRKFQAIGNAGEADIRDFLPRYVQMTYKNYPSIKLRKWLIDNVFDKKSDIAQALIDKKEYDNFMRVAETHLRNDFMSGMEPGASEASWLTNMVKTVYGADLSNQIFPHQAAMEYVKQKMYQNLLTRPAFWMLNSTDILIKTAMGMRTGEFIDVVPRMWYRMVGNMFNYKRGNDNMVDFLMDNAGAEGNLLAKMAGSGIATEHDAGIAPRFARKLFGQTGGKAYAKAANLWGKAGSLGEGQEKANRAGIFGAMLEKLLIGKHGDTKQRNGYSTYIEAYLNGKSKVTPEQWKDLVSDAKSEMLKFQGIKSAMMGGTIADTFVKDTFGKNSGMASLWSLSNMFLNYPINMIVRTVEAAKNRANAAEKTFAGSKGWKKELGVAKEAVKPAALTALMSFLIYGAAAKMKGEDIEGPQQALDLAFNEWGIRGIMPASIARDVYNILTGRIEKGATGLFKKGIPGVHAWGDTSKKIFDPMLGGDSDE